MMMEIIIVNLATQFRLFFAYYQRENATLTFENNTKVPQVLLGKP